MAANATAPPAVQPEAPRPVAKTTVPSKGETTIGGNVSAVTPGQPTAVTPMKPTAPAQRPKPVKQPPTRKILPGDLICGECGEGNPPARNFCSRCGSSLKAAVVAKRKWWQRLIPRRKRKSMEAGARPWKSSDGSQKTKTRSNWFARAFVKVRPIVAIAILLAGVLIGFSPNLREKVTGTVGDAKDSVMDKIQPSYVAIQPIRQSVTSELPDFPGENATDTNPLTYWVAPAADPEPTLVVTFDAPFDFEKIKIWNGSAEGFKDRQRVSTIHFVFDTGQSFDLEIDDLPDGQMYDVKNGKGVREVEVHVTGMYSSLTSADLGLSELEFYMRK